MCAMMVGWFIKENDQTQDLRNGVLGWCRGFILTNEMSGPQSGTLCPYAERGRDTHPQFHGRRGWSLCSWRGASAVEEPTGWETNRLWDVEHKTLSPQWLTAAGSRWLQPSDVLIPITRVTCRILWRWLMKKKKIPFEITPTLWWRVHI